MSNSASSPAAAASPAVERAPAKPHIAAWLVAALLSSALLVVLFVALKPGSTWMPANSYYINPSTVLYDAKTKARAAIVLDVGSHTFPDGKTEQGVRVRVIKGSDEWKALGIESETGWLRVDVIPVHFIVRAVDP